MFTNVGWSELLVLGVVALVVLGPERLPEAARWLASAIRKVHDFLTVGAPAPLQAAGVVAMSAGNHAQGLAWAAYRLGMPAIAVMPRTAPDTKVAGVAHWGAAVRLHGETELYTSAYPPSSLDRWAELCREWHDQGGDVHVYLDNDARGHAPHDAVALLQRLGGVPEHRATLPGGATEQGGG